MTVLSRRSSSVVSRKSRIRRASAWVVESLEPRRLMHFDPNHPDHFDIVPLAPMTVSSSLTPHVGPFAAVDTIPALNSLEDATAQLYLDFDGSSSMSWAGKTTGVVPAYDTDGDASTFTAGELTNIQQIWARVSEIYSPFNINVTTVDPGNLTDGVTTQVIIGGNGSWYGSAGGVAYIGGFYNGASNVAWVFPKMLANGNTKYTAEAIAHESGHTFGLQHQSTYSGSSKTAEYNPGTSAKAPIMGNSYSATRALWWSGQSSISSSTIQTDVTVLSNNSNGFGYRTDDHGATTGTATALDIDGVDVSQSGVIEQIADADWFSFTTLAGDITLSVAPAQYSGMLDAKLTLLASDGTTVVASADTSSMGETINASVSGGTYYLVVSSKGNAGDIGQFSITGAVITSPDYVARPTNLTAVQDSDEVDLTWTDSSTNETGFIIERSDDNGSTWDQVGTASANATGYNDTTTEFGAAYKYRVKATGSVENSSYSAVATVNLIPEGPTDLAAESVSSTQIDLSWTDVDGETGYKIERSLNGTAWTQIATPSADADSYSNTGLSATTKYYYRITAVSAAGNSAASTAVNATTTPPSPTTLAGTVTAASISLSWTNIVGETGYRIERSDDNSSWSQLATTAANVVSYANTGLTSNATYYYRVKAIGAGGDSPATSSLSKTTLLAAPADVFSFKPTANSLKVSWSDAKGETGYRLEQLVGTAWTQVGSNIAANTTTVTVSSLSAGTTYSFRVLGINASGLSAASDVGKGTTLAPAPSGLTAEALAGGNMKLTWTNVTGESGFKIERSLDSSTWKWIGTTSTDVLTYTDTQLALSTAYYYRVRAFSDGGNGAYSSTVNPTTLGNAQLSSAKVAASKPSNAATILLTGSIRLNWAGVKGASTFKIERSTNGTDWKSVKTVSSKVLSYVDAKLKKGTYSYRITAVNAAGVAIGKPTVSAVATA